MVRCYVCKDEVHPVQHYQVLVNKACRPLCTVHADQAMDARYVVVAHADTTRRI